MTPTKLRLEADDGLNLDVGSTENQDEAAGKIAIRTSKPSDTSWWLVVWNGHEFETIEVILTFYKNWLSSAHFDRGGVIEYATYLYYPIDPRMIVEDIAGATVAYPNTDNTGWLFAHCDQDFMIDHEYKVLGAVDTAFDNMLRTIPAIRSHHLVHFKEDVKEAVLVELRSYHLAYYHQNPHTAHIHEPLERAIAATVYKWNNDAPAKTDEYNIIKPYLTRISKAVANRHLYETRWDKAARITAAAKEAEQE